MEFTTVLHYVLVDGEHHRPRKPVETLFEDLNVTSACLQWTLPQPPESVTIFPNTHEVKDFKKSAAMDGGLLKRDVSFKQSSLDLWGPDVSWNVSWDWHSLWHVRGRNPKEVNSRDILFHRMETCLLICSELSGKSSSVCVYFILFTCWATLYALVPHTNPQLLLPPLMPVAHSWRCWDVLLQGAKWQRWCILNGSVCLHRCFNQCFSLF